MLGGYSLIAIGAIHVVLHFLFKRPSNPEELRMQTALLQHDLHVLGGIMSLEDIVDGLNIMYAIFLISMGGTTLVIHGVAGQSYVPRAFPVVLAGVFFICTIVAVFYFVWFHVVYFLAFTILFVVVSGQTVRR